MGSSECVNPGGSFGGIVSFDSVSCNITLREGYWLGYYSENRGLDLDNIDNISNKTLVAALCPGKYCYHDYTFGVLPAPNDSNFEEKVCSENRKGVLCGMCKKGYGPVVNSFHYGCVPCNQTSFIRRFAMYISLVHLQIFVLFLFIILLNINMTSGPANAFILFGQVVTTTFSFNGEGHIPHNEVISTTFYIPYTILNLEVINFYPVCLHQDMNTIDVLLLKYLMALSPILMIVLVVFSIKIKDRYTCICKLTCGWIPLRARKWWKKQRISFHSAFAAFLVLSYNRFCITTTYILDTSKLFNIKGEPIGERRVTFAGQLSVNDTAYKLYSCAAYLVLVVCIALPPIVLLGVPGRLRRIAVTSYTSKFWVHVNFWLDMYQGCFRDNMRFFASTYFVFRLVISVVHVFTDTWMQQFITQNVVCVAFAVAVALFQPYRRKFLNYVDALIFVDMILLNTTTIYLLYIKDTQNLSIHTIPYKAILMLRYCLFLLPMCYMALYISWQLLPKSVKKRVRANRVFCYHCCCKEREENSLAEQLLHRCEGSASLDGSIQSLLERAQEINTYKSPDVTN